MRKIVQGISSHPLFSTYHIALDKLRGVVHRLSQLESDRNLGDSTQAAVIRELRRRLHKKKATVDDGMSLAQRILLRRQQAQAFQQQEVKALGNDIQPL